MMATRVYEVTSAYLAVEVRMVKLVIKVLPVWMDSKVSQELLGKMVISVK